MSVTELIYDRVLRKMLEHEFYRDPMTARYCAFVADTIDVRARVPYEITQERIHAEGSMAIATALVPELERRRQIANAMRYGEADGALRVVRPLGTPFRVVTSLPMSVHDITGVDYPPEFRARISGWNGTE